MSSSRMPEITDRLSQYLAGISSLEAFDRWFVPRTWNVEEAEDPVAYGMIGEIYLRLAEYTRGDRTEDELKAALWSLMEGDEPATLASESSSRQMQ